MTPTAEQLACVEAATSTQDNLIINALAGAAKTTTLELIGKALSSTPILYLVFNKRNADEAKERLPGHIQVMTFNGCGHRAWAATIGKRLTIDTGKQYTNFKNIVDELPKAEKQEVYDFGFGDALKFVDRLRGAGYVPHSGLTASIKPLCTRDHFVEMIDDDFPEFLWPLVDEAILISIRQAYAGTIDFNDQIYMPTLFGGTFSRFPLVMADEAQDLSPLNHAMLKKLVTKRLIIVGDPWQSIYGFRGAVANGMASLRSQFNMRDLSLSTSFRCPKAVIRRQHSRVPQMSWPEWAIEGEIHDLTHSEWGPSSIPDGAAIICRNNAPLFKLGLDLIRARRGIKLVGADIGPNLIKTLKKLGELSLPQIQVLAAIDEWEKKESARSKKKESVADRAACLRVFATEGKNLNEAIIYAEHLFKATGTIELLSGHKSKGMEWHTVFHLDPWRIPSRFAEEVGGEALEQELNIKYVIETRAKRELFLVSLEHFDPSN